MATTAISSALDLVTSQMMSTDDYYDVTTNMNMSSNETITTMEPVDEEDGDGGAIYFEVLIILATYFYPLVVIGGVIFNCLSLSVLLTKGMRKVSISVYLSALAITDSLVLILDFINNYFKEVLGIYAIGVNDFLCTLYRFAFDVVFTFSAWLIVAITVERFIVVWFPLKVKLVTSVKKARIIALILFIAVCVYKLYNFWVWEVVDGKCDWKNGYEYFQTYVNMPLTFAAYSYIPLIILIICNITIIVKLQISAKNRAKLISNSTTHDQEANRVTFTVMMISFAYMILTIPLSAYYTIQYADNQFIEQTPQMAMGEMIILLIGLSNHGINFFLYILSSKNFRKTMLHMYRLDKLIKGSSSGTNKHGHDQSQSDSRSKSVSGSKNIDGSNSSTTNLSMSNLSKSTSTSTGLNTSSVSINVEPEPQPEKQGV